MRSRSADSSLSTHPLHRPPCLLLLLLLLLLVMLMLPLPSLQSLLLSMLLPLKTLLLLLLPLAAAAATTCDVRHAPVVSRVTADVASVLVNVFSLDAAAAAAAAKRRYLPLTLAVTRHTYHVTSHTSHVTRQLWSLYSLFMCLTGSK